MPRLPAESQARLKTLRHIFGNVWVWLGLAAYGVSLAILWRNKTFAPEDAISLLVIFGLALPLLAWVTTLRAHPLTLTVQRRASEMWLLFACLVGVTFCLVWGTALSEALVPASWLASARGKFFVVLIRKLIVFVAIPFVLFRVVFGYRWRDFGLQSAGFRALARNQSAGGASPQRRHSCLSVFRGQRRSADPAR